MTSEATGAAESGTPNPGKGRLWAFGVAAGLIAGVVAWLGGEVTADWYPAERRHVHDSMGQKLFVPTPETLRASDTKTSLTAFGTLGGVLGLVLGMAGGFVRRSEAAAMRWGVVGIVLGQAAGIGVTYALLPAYFGSRGNDDLVPSLLIHMGIWSAVGGAAGLAFGFGLGGLRLAPRSAIGGAVGGAAGAVLYEFVGGAVFVLAETTRLVSLTPGSRLLARLPVCLFAALGAALAAAPPRARPSETAPDVATRPTGA